MCKRGRRLACFFDVNFHTSPWLNSFVPPPIPRKPTLTIFLPFSPPTLQMQDAPTFNETDALLGGSRAPQGSVKSRLLLVAVLGMAAGLVGYSSGYHAHYSGHLDLERVEDFSNFVEVTPTLNSEGQYGAEDRTIDFEPDMKFDPNAGLEQYDDMMKRKDEISSEFMENVKEALAQQKGQYGGGEEESVDGSEAFGDIFKNGHYGAGDIGVDVSDSSGPPDTVIPGVDPQVDVVVEDTDHPAPEVPTPELTDSMERDLVKQGKENEIVIQSEADLARYEKNFERVKHVHAPLEGDAENADDAAHTDIHIEDNEDPDEGAVIHPNPNPKASI